MSQYCTFTLDRHLFGVPVSSVQEVLRAQGLTRVPLAHEDIAGLLNLRGQIVTSLELRSRLGLEPRDEGAPSVNVVVKTPDGGVVSLVVDEIGDVLEPSRDSFETPPDTVPTTIRDLVTQVCKLDDHLMLLLDTERAVTPGGTS
ncbi:chemotaxis protein CheW [Nocardioides KLBMP 9356]|uniref:Chemotaxis protein CheW n=1 Tax=Nocardioides potassii TaxID=2911371 RepID=A0ABS9HE76_9ACTN|nr:chemotaxis protein CheW [Nocardioides potassii]MCF6378411.1 chemotaxis protein CheW [Nocardioides potassii]